MTILILGGADDEHAAHMRHYLQTQGGDVEFLDTRDFPQRLQISYDPLANTAEMNFPQGRKLQLAEVQAVYWRNYFGPGPVNLPHAEQAYIAQNDARGLLEALLMNLPCRWVNGFHAFRLHQTKAVQLHRIAQLGVKTPATLLGNSPEAVRAFATAHPGCIFKPVQGGAHTRAVLPAHLTDENLRNLAVAPVTLQQMVPGTNIRVFVAGERVLACEVRTEFLDFRDDPDPWILPVDLPEEIEQQSRDIARALDLLWTGIDFRLSPEEEYFFLEANPSPMFLGFERRTGLPLTESLAALLM